MAYGVQSKKNGKTYFLHSKEVSLRGGKKQRIYYFAEHANEFAMDRIPDGYEVIENAKTGLPMLRKAK